MAIAYYIPDQSKLAEKKPSTKVVKNIKIPVNHHTLGTNTCWELIAQVFCYALRCHHLAAGSGALQISIEFIPPVESAASPNHKEHGQN